MHACSCKFIAFDGNSIFVVAIIAIIEIPAIKPIFTTLLKSMIYSHLIDKINNIIRNKKENHFKI